MTTYSYEPLYKTLDKNNISLWKLIELSGLSQGQRTRIRDGKNISLTSICLMCEVLDCDITDIVKLVKDR